METMTGLQLRRLPPAAATTTCEGCGATIVWARTVAGPNGPGGRWMPLNPLEDLAGNVAVTAPHRDRLHARVISRDEDIDRPHEYAGQTHYATCRTRTHPAVPEQLVDLAPAVRKPRRRRTRW